MQLLLATGNPGKAREIREAFSELKNIEWKTLADFPELPDPQETGETFEANALLKAQYYAELLKIPALADDSGFTLDALPGKFGVKTRREISAKDDMEWMTRFLEILESLESRRATFSCALAFYDPLSKLEKICLGQVEGEMKLFPQTPLEPGIPVSSVFCPEGSEIVFSAMTKQEKNQFSHRGRAATQMREFLNSL